MIHIPTNDGRWVNEGFAHLQEILKDFSHSKNCDLELRWIPPDKRTTQDEKAKPYCIFDNRSQKPVFFASELDSPTDILAKLLDIDNTNGDVLKRLDAHNDAVKLMEYKKNMDSMQEANDLAAFLVRSPLNYLHIKDKRGNNVKLDDERRRLSK